MSTEYAEYQYHGTQHWDPAFAGFLVNVVKGLHGVESICELGCGNGALARLLAQEGFHVEGVDASESGIQVAQRDAKGAVFHHDRIDAGLARRLRRTESFDLVLGSEVIEHLYRPGDLVDAARALVRPAGWLLLTTPYHGYLKYLALALSGRMDRHLNPNWDGGHIKFFSVGTLSSLLDKHGFCVNRYLFQGRFPSLWKRMIVIATVNSEKQH